MTTCTRKLKTINFIYVYIYTLKYIYTYIKETAIRKRTIDMLKNNGSRKHKQLPALKFHVLHFFSFQVIGESARFRVFRKMPSSHARRGEFWEGGSASG